MTKKPQSKTIAFRLGFAILGWRSCHHMENFYWAFQNPISKQECSEALRVYKRNTDFEMGLVVHTGQVQEEVQDTVANDLILWHPHILCQVVSDHAAQQQQCGDQSEADDLIH